jgi:Spy/CpxP family protein refolding chaperone
MEKLNLTPEQKTQVHRIFSDARQQAQPLVKQLRQFREQIRAAAKAGNNSAIDQLTQQQAPVAARMAAVRARAFEKFYAVLNPQQKQQVDAMPHFSHMRGGERRNQNAS